METVERIKQICAQFVDTFKKKNSDYGDSYKEFGLLGIVIRMNDKMNRVKTLMKKEMKKEKMEVLTESLYDTLFDLGVYSTMALSIIEEEKEHENNRTIN